MSAAVVTKCTTCDAEMLEKIGDDGCIDGDYYTSCGHENCYGLCEYTGYCPCTCHERDDKGHLTRQLKLSVWPGPYPKAEEPR